MNKSLSKYPFCKQLDSMDCGPACVKMVAQYYQKNYPLQFLREKSFITRMGVSMAGMSHAAEYIGIRTLGVKVPIEKLIAEAPFPCILHWNQIHFVVLYSVTKRPFSKERIFTIGDPAVGIVKIPESTFKNCWITD